jgi:glycine oxidase
MITVTLNGKPRTVDAEVPVPDLLRQLDINARLVAVAINGEVIPKKLLAATTVHDGDVIEIVRMVGGGATKSGRPGIQPGRSRTSNFEPRASAECVIVGAGIVGCAIAYELSRRGVSCLVLESRRLGMAATNAAAGVLSPLAEFARPDALVQLGLRSLRLYPQWVARLRDEVPDIDVEFATNGVLRVAFNEEELAGYRAGLRYRDQLGVELIELDRKLVHEVEPRISERIIGGIFSPEEGQVSNQLFTLALSRAAKKRGVRFIEGAPVVRFLRRGARVPAVRTPQGDFACDRIVLCAGPWTRALAKKLRADLPTFPVRGQMLALGGMVTPIGRPVWGRRGYVMPRANGLIFAGATVERAGFRIRTTKRGLAFVRRGAFELVPQLRQAREHFTWAGLRPGSPDGLPIMGALPGWDNVTVATGHFRNGILLAPITAELIAAALVDRDTAPLAPFDPARFQLPLSS